MHTDEVCSLSGRRDSNPQHSAWKAEALPIELLPHIFKFHSAWVRCGYQLNYFRIWFCKLNSNSRISQYFFYFSKE